jgi:hypothetical protein
MTYDDREDTEPCEVMHSKNICPKCGRTYFTKNLFINDYHPRNKVGVIWHSTEKIKGSSWIPKCLLTQEEWDSIEEPKYISTFDPKRPIVEIVLEQGFHSKGSLILKQKS